MDEPSAFATAAAQVRRGEWTTYGDVAAAAGRPANARAVGHEAASAHDFPNAHRVLRADGTVSRGPGEHNDGSAVRARRLLEDEGVRFSATGRADPAARIYWDELQRRLGVTSRRR